MRRFHLHRTQDDTGTSGVGVVAEGCRFYDNTVCLRWLSATPSFVTYASVEDVIAVHGHEGHTTIVWVDIDD